MYYCDLSKFIELWLNAEYMIQISVAFLFFDILVGIPRRAGEH